MLELVLLALLAVPKVEAPKQPKLILTASPRIALAEAGSESAKVRFRATILGEITEEWYCPEIEWTWSDGATRREQEDCAPWDAGEEGPTSWVQTKRLGRGENLIVVRLLKGGKLLAQQEVYVEVK